MIIAAALICIILSIIVLKLIPQKQIQPPLKEIRLVVLPFENLGPFPLPVFIREGMSFVTGAPWNTQDAVAERTETVSP